MRAAIYHYVGPDHLRGLRRGAHCIQPRTSGDLLTWTAEQIPSGKRAGSMVATFVVDAAGNLWIADRRSEHIACADGGSVLAAGEITCEINGSKIEVTGISNLSTGFCPEPECWPSVATALDRLGVVHPDGFTDRFIFRKCPECKATTLVKDEVLECETCGHQLPSQWNF